MRRHLVKSAIPGLILVVAAAAPLASAEAGEGTREGAVPEGKTWTNEDLKVLEGGVSFLGGSGFERLHLDAAPSHSEEWWRRRAGLHGQRLADLDRRIQDLEHQRARAANPFTRALAGTAEGPDGGERLLSAVDIQAEIDRLKEARGAEMRGVQALQEAALNQAVPPDWLEGLPAEAAKDVSSGAVQRGPRVIRPTPGGGSRRP